MGTFTFGEGGTPKKILYKGVEVKKILFNGIEVWHKAIEAGSRSVTIEHGQTKTISFTVPDGVTKLKITTNNGVTRGLPVTPGETVKFTFQSFSASTGYYNHQYLTKYVFQDTEEIIGDARTITIEWSEEINNSTSS